MVAPAPNQGCRALFAHLSEYLDGELPQVECDKIEEHCRTCARCRHVIGSLRRTIALCRESGRQVRPPMAVRARALARVAQLLEEAPPSG
ncbi:MAG: zf-HC2 domain-containing protein, partial [Acidobacteriota bacterium]|nr:zf-HC2 domain-containing protein [Acidobacteriota bacterium]